MTVVSQNTRRAIEAMQSIRDLRDSLKADPEDSKSVPELISELTQTIADLKAAVNKISGGQSAEEIKTRLSEETSDKKFGQISRYADGCG